MAEAILRFKANETIAVRSAGIHAQDGWPISSHAKTLIEAANMPYTPVSRSVSEADLKWADFVFTMTESHKLALLEAFPEVGTKTFTLKEFVRPASNADVIDPFGGNLDIYRQTFDELVQLIDELQQQLLEG